MGTDKQEEEDDGRVIADMSGIETPSLFAPCLLYTSDAADE